MAISDLARREVVTVGPEAAVPDVAELMEDESVGSVVVVEGDEPVGMVTDRDLAIEVVSHGRDPTGLVAADVMTADPFTVRLSDGIYDVLERTSEEGVRRIPVVDDDGRLAGIVTLDDVIVLLTGELEFVSAVVQAGSPPY